MADVIAWSKLNKINKKSDIIKSSVEGVGGTVDLLVDGVQQLKNDTITNTETIGGMNTNMDKLVEDVHNEIQANPTGLPAPPMSKFITSTSKEGIKIDYAVRHGMQPSGNYFPSLSDYDSKPYACSTKGVMVRFSSKGYPINHEDGELAFIDTDVISLDEQGHRIPKQKTQIVTKNMVLNTTYYFSAFPFTNYNVYNEQLGIQNCKQEKYMGAVGTVKVNVSADIVAKPFDDYTLTLSNGSNTYTKKGSGESEIVFTGVKAAAYTLTISAIGGYTTPNQQSIVVTEGQTKNVTMQYRNTVTFATASWADIDAIGKSGKASSVFSLHDTKNITCNGGETVTLEIVGFNHDDLQKGGKAPITVAMKHIMRDYRMMNSKASNSGGFPGSEMYKWLNDALFNSLPTDLRAVIKPVNKKTSAGGGSSIINTNAMKMWLFSEKEVFGTTTYSVNGEGNQYPVFTNNQSRVKKMLNGSGKAGIWWLRSPCSDRSDSFCLVIDDGTVDWTSAYVSFGVGFGFCV